MGKSILVQVHRPAYRDEIELCHEADARFLASIPALMPDSDIRPAVPSPPETNAWLIIKDTVYGPQISEIFRVLPQDKSIHSRIGTGCVIVGSHLYDICGVGSIDTTRNGWSNQIRRLDTRNPQNGWKSEDLPLYCSHPRTVVSGNFIYVFPGPFPFSQNQNGASSPLACVYNTLTHKSDLLRLPANQPVYGLCVPVIGGIKLPIKNKCWLHMSMEEDEWKEVEDSLLNPKLLGLPYAISNGILYVLDCFSYRPSVVLHMYEMRSWTLHGLLYLPKFDNLDVEDDEVYMIATSESELCFLWHGVPSEEMMKKEESPLYYAKIEVFLDEAPAARILKQTVFRINANGVTNCLPYTGEEDHDFLHAMEADANKRMRGKKRELMDLCHHNMSTFNKMRHQIRKLQYIASKDFLSFVDTDQTSQMPGRSRSDDI